MTDEVSTLNEIFNIIRSESRTRLFCIFNKLPRLHGDPLNGFTDNPMWCNNSALIILGDHEGLEFICEKCLHKSFDFSQVKIKQ